MAFKFVRACDWTYTSGVSHLFNSTLRLVYEMWCYCVNGGSSTTTPGGVASAAPYQNFPANYFEGTSVLATGTDGTTSVSSAQLFSSASASFTSAMVGKHLVVWKPGSDSSDDSIYPIRAVPNANTLIVESRCGGTPHPVTLRPGFTDKSGVHYRIIDLGVVQPLVPANGNFIVFQTTASLFNAGQANTQFQILYRAGGATNGLIVSPAGTWNGSAFTDGTAEIQTAVWSGGSGTAYMNMIADKGALIFFSETPSGRFVLHLEIPVRQYTQVQDPNPVVFQQHSSYTTYFRTDISNDGWGGGFRTVNTLGQAVLSRTLVRGMTGDSADSTWQPSVPGSTQINPYSAFNPLNGKVHSSEAMMAILATGQYTIARMRLRGVRVGPAYYPRYMRFGDFGEWIHMKNGIYLPWDNAVLPFNYFPITVP
jgi:hypothetical protein